MAEHKNNSEPGKPIIQRGIRLHENGKNEILYTVRPGDPDWDQKSAIFRKESRDGNSLRGKA